MYLKKLLIINYRSCRKLAFTFDRSIPNVLIGINDCGKTTVLKAIGLLLEEKSQYFATRENSSKKDFSNSPLSEEEFTLFIKEHVPYPMAYTGNETVIVGNFVLEDQDIDKSSTGVYSNQLLWAVENSINEELWLARAFQADSTGNQTMLLTYDSRGDNGDYQCLWDKSATDINKVIKTLAISEEDINNENKQGRFSNLEKLRAIYAKSSLEPYWASYKIEKGDKGVFPTFRYLDWNSSLDDIKKTASDAMSAIITEQLKPIRDQANLAARTTEIEVNGQLQKLHSSIADMVPSITAIKTKIYFEVKESVTDILINKVKSDGDIHLDLQGEGVKRQIWFALLKSAALASVQSTQQNKKFIWAFDEPETHLYPSAQRQFFDIIKDVSASNVQTFVCTHSTVFIDKAQLNSIISVSLNEDSYTDYSCCTSVDDVFDALELRNSDFLFHDKFLVVEGDTEALLIPELYKLYFQRTLRQDNIQLINLSGKNKWIENKKALEKVLNDFRKPLNNVVYLFDADMKHDLGASANAPNFFFVGKQDIEDSIPSKVWRDIVNDILPEGKVSVEEIELIKSSIPDTANLSNNQKFYPKLQKYLRQKMPDQLSDGVWDLLPAKGTDSAKLILKHLITVDNIPNEIAAAFSNLITASATDLSRTAVMSKDVLAEV